MLISFSLQQNLLYLSYCRHLLDCIIHYTLGQEVNDSLLENSLFEVTIASLVFDNTCPNP